MSSENKSISLRLGAELGSSFKSTFEGADHRLNRLNSTVKDFKARLKDIGRLEKLERKTKDAGQAWLSANQALSAHKKTLVQAGTATIAQSKHLDKLILKSKKARATFLDQKTSLTELRQGLSQAGINTRQLTKESQRLENAMEATTQKTDRLNSALKRIKDNRQHRADLRGGIMETVGTTVATAFPIVNAARMQESSDRLNSVLSLGKLDPKIAKFAKEASIKAAQLGVTNFAGANDIQYAFNSAGLGNLVARKAIVPVAKAAYVAKVSEDVMANDSAGIFNNFFRDKIDNSDPKEVEKYMKRSTDLFTATAIKYHYDNGSQVNQALRGAAGAMAQQNARPDESLAFLGTLANSRVDEGTAGVALRQFLTQMSVTGTVAV